MEGRGYTGSGYHSGNYIYFFYIDLADCLAAYWRGLIRIHNNKQVTVRRESASILSPCPCGKGERPNCSEPLPNQPQIIRLIRNRLIPKSPNNPPVSQEENPRHLIRIFLNQPNAMLARRAALQPALPYRGNQ